jgi:hypothetical protein
MWRITGGGYGGGWEDLDEDISVRGLLRIHSLWSFVDHFFGRAVVLSRTIFQPSAVFSTTSRK